MNPPTLRHAAPVLAMDNPNHRWGGDPIPGGQISRRDTPSGIGSADLDNLVNLEFGARLLLTPRDVGLVLGSSVGPALRVTVGNVVDGCPKKQVGRVTARRVVAGMAARQFTWVNSGGDEVRDPVSKKPMEFPKPYNSISVLVKRSSPWPAGFCITSLNPGAEVINDAICQWREGAVFHVHMIPQGGR